MTDRKRRAQKRQWAAENKAQKLVFQCVKAYCTRSAWSERGWGLHSLCEHHALMARQHMAALRARRAG
jgi:hypothetical protein